MTSHAGVIKKHTAELLEQLDALGERGTVQADGRDLSVTHLDKQLFEGITKRDLLRYLVNVSDIMLPYLQNRPINAHVFPDGVGGRSFWRKDVPDYAPDWLQTWKRTGDDGKTTQYVLCNDVATLLWLGNAAVIDIHPWHSRVDAIDQPDWAVFDLDPTSSASFDDVKEAATLIRKALEHLKLESFLKASGQTGLQIYVPMSRSLDYDAVRDWVASVGRAVSDASPELVSWEWEVGRRRKKIRIDYTQNVIGKTLVAPYSPRPTTNATISMPVAWDDLDDDGLRPDAWTVQDVADAHKADTFFAGVLSTKQRLPSLS